MFQKLIQASVFRRSTAEEKASPVSILVLLFHRGSAIKYLILATWALAGMAIGLESMATLWGEPFQLIYSLTTSAVAFSCAVFAAYYPLFARHELFASSLLMGLMLTYTIALVILSIERGVEWIPLTIFSLLPFVFPSIRAVIIYSTLIAEAERKKRQ